MSRKILRVWCHLGRTKMYRAVQQPTGGSRRSGNQRIASTLFLHFNPKAKNKILLRVACWKTPGTTNLMELFLNTWFHLKILNQWKFAHMYIDSLSNSLNIVYINILHRSMYIPVYRWLFVIYIYDPATRQIFESALKEWYAYYVQWWSSTGTCSGYSTGLPVHPRKCYMCIQQCGWRGFAIPSKPGQSNGGNNSE